MRRPQAPATPHQTTRGLQPTGHNRDQLVAATLFMVLASLMGAANLPLVSCLRYDEIEIRRPLQEHSAMSTAPQQLHDKATRGEPLSAEEQTHLEQWYARLDDEELTPTAEKHGHECRPSRRVCNALSTNEIEFPQAQRTRPAR